MATRHPAIPSKPPKPPKPPPAPKPLPPEPRAKPPFGPPVASPSRTPVTCCFKPVVSEKSYALLDENKYTFIVAPSANKTQIKQAVQAVFSVKVTGVNTINRNGKRKRTRTGFGKRAATKRAIVTLAEGDRIDIFGGPAS